MEDLENATPFGIGVAEREQFRGDLAVRLPAALRELAAQSFGQHHDFRALLGMAQAALGPRAARALAITGGFEFGNKASLLVLCDSANPLISWNYCVTSHPRGGTRDG